MVLLYHISLRCGIIKSGKVAEWLKALVLKTRDGNIRRFESCPFRHGIKIDPEGLILFHDGRMRTVGSTGRVSE